MDGGRAYSSPELYLQFSSQAEYSPNKLQQEGRAALM